MSAQKLRPCCEAHPKTVRKDGTVDTLAGCDGCEIRLLRAELVESGRALAAYKIRSVNLDWALTQIANVRESDLPLRRFIAAVEKADGLADPADLERFKCESA